MLFMCIGTWRDLDEAGQQRMLDVFDVWKPPAGLEMKSHWVTPSGMDFVVAEVDSFETLAEGVANWAPFIDYEVFPIAEAATAVAGIQRAVAQRLAMGPSR